MIELLRRSPTQQVYDLNQEPLSPSELRDHLSGIISSTEGNANLTVWSIWVVITICFDNGWTIYVSISQGTANLNLCTCL
jgi:hypothetical protein